MTFKEIEKMHDIASTYSVKCECGHTVLVSNRYKRIICKWCGRWVYANKEAKRQYEGQEFIYKMKGLLKK
jgi:RNase P subunit RPR2